MKANKKGAAFAPLLQICQVDMKFKNPCLNF
jgi:hypothetical protein